MAADVESDDVAAGIGNSGVPVGQDRGCAGERRHPWVALERSVRTREREEGGI